MSIGKGMFIFQLSWISACNSFTYWDSSMSVIFTYQTVWIFTFMVTWQFPKLFEYEPNKNAKLFYPTQSLNVFLCNVPLPLQHTTFDILKYWK